MLSRPLGQIQDARIYHPGPCAHQGRQPVHSQTGMVETVGKSPIPRWQAADGSCQAGVRGTDAEMVRPAAVVPDRMEGANTNTPLDRTIVWPIVIRIEPWNAINCANVSHTAADGAGDTEAIAQEGKTAIRSGGRPGIRRRWPGADPRQSGRLPASDFNPAF